MRLFPIYTWTKGFRNFGHRRRTFFNQPWAQGVVLLVCVIVAMLLANLPATGHIYHNLLETKLSIFIKVPGWKDIMFPKGMTVEGFINDILMTVFFFTVGLEIRREMKNGELSSIKKALMPVIAAFGGVIVPALTFVAVNHGTAASSGWGIPTATDIAFAVGILSILGDKVPVSLKVFLTALAIADDLIAILVVALFYGGAVNLGLLSIAFVLVVGLLIMNKLGEKRAWYYFIPAMVIWALFYYSGIHSTMSGVVMAFLVPMSPRYNEAYFRRKRKQYIKRISEYKHIDGSSEFPNGPQRHCLRRMSVICRRGYTGSVLLQCISRGPGTRRSKHGYIPWPPVGQTVGNLPRELHRSQAARRGNACQCIVEDADSGSLPWRYRIHDVHIRRHPLVRGAGA